MNKATSDQSAEARLAAERLIHECDITAESESGFTKDIRTVSEFALAATPDKPEEGESFRPFFKDVEKLPTAELARRAKPDKPSASDEEIARKAAEEICEGLLDEEAIANIVLCAIQAARTAPLYLKCAECSQPTLRYSTTIDGLRCQTCGVAYLNTKQVEKITAAPSEVIQHQADAWNGLVAALIVDYGLKHTEPGEIMFEQVLNFIKRKLAAPSEPGEDQAFFP